MNLVEPENELHCAYAEGPGWKPWIGYSFGRPDRIYFPNNRARSGDVAAGEALAARRDLARLRNLVIDAESSGKQVHAVGSGWSFSSVAFTSGHLVSTRGIQESALGLDEILPIEQLHIPEHVREMSVFVHGGCTLDRVMRHIDHADASPRRALVACGGSAGQTVAGLISTGTHGSHPHEAPPSDAVLALLVVAEGGKVYWIQRPDGPVARGGVPYADFEGEVIADAATMDAAILSLGCFGIIYAVLMKVRPIRWLLATRVERRLGSDLSWLAPASELRTVLESPATQFVEVVLNPHLTNAGGGASSHTAHFTTCRLAPAGGVRPSELPPLPLRTKLELIWILGKLRLLTRVAPAYAAARVPHYVDRFIRTMRPLETTCWVSRCHDLVARTAPEIRVASCEVAFPREMTVPVVDRLTRWVRKAAEGPRPFVFPGAVSLRYSAPSRATLSMITRRDGGPNGSPVDYDTTAEIFAVEMIHGRDRTRARLTECVDDLVRLGAIPHWGQIHRPNPAVTLCSFGAERLRAWRRAYRRLNPTRRTFENDFARAAGLLE